VLRAAAAQCRNPLFQHLCLCVGFAAQQPKGSIAVYQKPPELAVRDPPPANGLGAQAFYGQSVLHGASDLRVKALQRRELEGTHRARRNVLRSQRAERHPWCGHDGCGLELTKWWG
jgi:hypothetical protein